DNAHQVGYYDRLNERDTYQVSAGTARSGATASGYYSHSGDLSQVNASASYQAGEYSSLGLSVQGGATATLKGAALHRNSISGGTRMLLDTDGV
ncbi:fimbria/pilus outer membrane usher protein, partial [Erwinia persicina]|uniref:fimbria/pilus outer membrane usher protein n=1 Tax=Erwinia persicina TaxID=55211 RepID=UPI00177FD004